MVKKTLERGFTLIELLVVIAIIGILASVVLASLNSARDKGADAAVRSSLNNARAQAELHYDNNSRSYATVCTAAGGIGPMLQGAANAGGFGTPVTNNATAGTASTVVCHGSAAAWAAAAPLKSIATQSYYCVDSTGNSKVTTSVLSGGSYVCP